VHLAYLVPNTSILRPTASGQAALFVATEAVALALNAALYHGVASLFPLVPATAVLARAVTTNLVFLLWSYPVWKRVFAAPTSRAAA